MKVSKGDYVLVEDREDDEEGAKSKPVVARVRAITTKGIETRLEDLPHIESKIRVYDADAVLMNFGAKPYPGKAYGFDFAERYRRALETDYGSVHLFHASSEEDRTRFVESFNRVGRRLVKLGLGKLYDTNTVYEIRGKRGKYAGMFMPTKEKSNKPNRMLFFVEVAAESLDYVILHEMGHLFHHATLEAYPRILSSWQVAFNRTVIPAEVLKEDSKKLLASWFALQSETEVQSLRVLSKELEEETRPQLRAVLQWITQNHGVRAHELDTLMLAENHDEIKSLWPDRTIAAKRDLKPLVSEYACKAMPELIAESFAFYVLKKKLPQSITKLLEKSLALGKRSL